MRYFAFGHHGTTLLRAGFLVDFIDVRSGREHLGERLDYSTQPLIWAAITAAAMKRHLAHMTQRLTGVRTSTHKLAKGAKMEVLESQFGDSKYRPAPLLRKMVDAGYLGRQRGRGSFEYGQWWVISVWLG